MCAYKIWIRAAPCRCHKDLDLNQKPPLPYKDLEMRQSIDRTQFTYDAFSLSKPTETLIGGELKLMLETRR